MHIQTLASVRPGHILNVSCHSSKPNDAKKEIISFNDAEQTPRVLKTAGFVLLEPSR